MIVLHFHSSHQSTTAATTKMSNESPTNPTTSNATTKTSTLKPIDNNDTEQGTSLDPSHSNFSTTTKKPDSGHHSSTYELVQVHWEHVKDPLVFTIVVIVAGLSKIGFHQSHFLSSKVPESCVLIIIGVIFGLILKFTNTSDKITLYAPHEFFLYLLPPIILESAFSLYDRTFVDNLGGVLLFAVWGTILNCFLIGLTLWGLYLAGAMEDIGFTFVQVLVFSALIVAVDPVAVLAVFQEVGVNNTLYFLVFGESLLNDGVTVVMYNVMQVFNGFDTITVGQCFLGVAKFCIVCSVATLIGIVFGLIASFLTKFTHSVKVVEPMIVFGFAYISYLISEMFQFSGIVSIIACGVVLVHYAFHNVTKKSKKAITFISKVMANACEIIIFMFIGLVTVNQTHVWKSEFILWTIILCIVYRFVVTYFLSMLVNRYASTRVRKISYMEMFMISYGGLRGAICFSLAAMIDETAIPAKNLFVTTTLFVIFFTVFVQGASIKWLTKKLRIALAESNKEMSLNTELSQHMFDHMCTAIEEIVGYSTGQFRLKAKIYQIDDSIIRPRILRHATTTKLDEFTEYYEKLVMKEHYKNLQLSGAKLTRVKTAIRRLDSDFAMDKLVESESKREAADLFQKTVERREQEMQEENKRLGGDDLKVFLSTLNATQNRLHKDVHDKNMTSSKGRRSSMVNFLRKKRGMNKALREMRRKSDPDAFAFSDSLPTNQSFTRSPEDRTPKHATVTEEDETKADNHEPNGNVTFEL
ncbi:sodium/hydrogen exchanger 3-like [Dreissena polymorpha]|nr:sodium/hydrogen exchanger 3-like [Dreissena polymorpha]